MMTEISLNVLDVAENSTRAEASLIEISVLTDTSEDTMTIIIKDDGCGMTPEQLAVLIRASKGATLPPLPAQLTETEESEYEEA